MHLAEAPIWNTLSRQTLAVDEDQGSAPQHVARSRLARMLSRSAMQRDFEARNGSYQRTGTHPSWASNTRELLLDRKMQGPLLAVFCHLLFSKSRCA
jgi:hypothetical protein